jgi:hypothetical protein
MKLLGYPIIPLFIRPLQAGYILRRNKKSTAHFYGAGRAVGSSWLDDRERIRVITGCKRLCRYRS